MKLLAAGRQKEAEALLETACARPNVSNEVVFLRTVCLRSRFQVGESLGGWAHLITHAGDTPAGQAAACILGQDMAENTPTALYYFSGLIWPLHATIQMTP